MTVLWPWPWTKLVPHMRVLTSERICNDRLACEFFARFRDRYVQTGPHVYVLHETPTLARIVRIGMNADYQLELRNAERQYRFWLWLEKFLEETQRTLMRWLR